MSPRLPDGSKKLFDDGDVWEAYVDMFANHGMKLQFTKVALERFHRKEEDHFGLP